jgi:hypothetical protein
MAPPSRRDYQNVPAVDLDDDDDLIDPDDGKGFLQICPTQPD